MRNHETIHIYQGFEEMAQIELYNCEVEEIEAELIPNYTTSQLQAKVTKTYGSISRAQLYRWMKSAQIPLKNGVYDDDDLEKLICFVSLLKRHRYLRIAAYELRKIYPNEENQNGYKSEQQRVSTNVTNQSRGTINEQRSTGYTITIG